MDHEIKFTITVEPERRERESWLRDHTSGIQFDAIREVAEDIYQILTLGRVITGEIERDLAREIMLGMETQELDDLLDAEAKEFSVAIRSGMRLYINSIKDSILTVDEYRKALTLCYALSLIDLVETWIEADQRFEPTY